MTIRKLITSLMATAILLHFMTKSPSSKIIFIPGAVIAIIGMGFLVLKYRETNSLIEMVESFGLWILIPVLMTLVGIFQVVKCLKSKVDRL